MSHRSSQMQDMATSGAPAARSPASTVTVIPTSPIDLDVFKGHLLRHLDSERAPPTSATIVIEPRGGVLFSFADKAIAQRAVDILRALHMQLSGNGETLFKVNVRTANPPEMASGWGPRGAGCGLSMDPRTCSTIPQPRNPTNNNRTRIRYLDCPAGAGAAATAAAAAAAEPAAPAPAEPAGSSQLAQMGGHRHPLSSISSSVNRPSDRHRHHGAAPEMRRSAGECSSSSRHAAPAAVRVPGRQLRALLNSLRPSASNCCLPAPRRLGAEQPFSGEREMYIIMQRGEACGIKNVGSLNFPLVLFDSLAGARIFRAVAALLHMHFCKPPSSRVAKRLERCFEKLLTCKLQRLLAADCSAFVGRPRADVRQRDVEKYLTDVVHPMLARR